MHYQNNWGGGQKGREVNNGNAQNRISAGEFAELSSSYICIELYFIFPCLLVKIISLCWNSKQNNFTSSEIGIELPCEEQTKSLIWDALGLWGSNMLAAWLENNRNTWFNRNYLAQGRTPVMQQGNWPKPVENKVVIWCF